MNIKIVVATHKQYKMPQDKMYVPVHVGRILNDNQQGTAMLSYVGDDTGDNISGKNKNYCELTGLYWGWKNIDAEYLGIVHYRRYFKGSGGEKWNSILTKSQAENLLKEFTVILPKKRHYFIESTYDQYVHAHNKQDLDKTFDIIAKFYPQYLPAWHKVMKSTAGHRFNMFIMRKDILDSYLEWLFDILFKLETVLDLSEYSENDRRVFGFVSERLLDVWMITNNIPYTELPVIYMESQNWPKKIFNFLKRKFVGK